MAHFALNRLGVLTLLQPDSTAYFLRVESVPTQVPPALNSVFPGKFAATHELLVQYRAIAEYVWLIFEGIELMEMPTKTEQKVARMLKPEYLKLQDELQDKLAKLSKPMMTNDQCLAAFELFILKADRLLDKARTLVKGRKPIPYKVIEVPLQLEPVPPEEFAAIEPRCKAYNAARKARILEVLRMDDNEVDEAAKKMAKLET